MPPRMGANGHNGMRRLMEANADLYGAIRLATFPAFEATDTRVPDGSADVVLTFRNVHNWQMGYQRDDQAYGAEAFRQMYRMLKPGGTLGVVDHRLPESAGAERERTSGYIKVSTVRRLAEAPASASSARPRSTPIRATPPTGRTASGRCRRRSATATSTAPRYRGDRRERPDDAEVRAAGVAAARPSRQALRARIELASAARPAGPSAPASSALLSLVPGAACAASAGASRPRRAARRPRRR